jgi:hypothetical protein
LAKHTGKIFPTNSSGDVLIGEYLGNKRYKVTFLASGNTGEYDTSAIRKGHIRDNLLKTGFNIGFIGNGRFKSAINRKPTYEYIVWRNMLMRCYSEEVQKIYKTYMGCTVCEEWHNFQNFAEWYYEQRNHHEKDFHLDKDLVLPDNKVYCPEYCRLIPKRLNRALVLGSKKSIYRAKNKFVVTSSVLSLDGTSTQKYIGSFERIEEALSAAREGKVKFIRSLYDLYVGILDQEILDIIKGYKLPVN